MIKLNNKEASILISPAAQRLFSDNRRPFPVRDTFLLLDIIRQIEDRLKPYRDKLQTEDDYKEFEKIEFEYSFNPITIKDDWPKLSVQEAMILNPIIKKE